MATPPMTPTINTIAMYPALFRRSTASSRYHAAANAAVRSRDLISCPTGPLCHGSPAMARAELRAPAVVPATRCSYTPMPHGAATSWIGASGAAAAMTGHPAGTRGGSVRCAWNAARAARTQHSARADHAPYPVAFRI